VAKTTLCLVFVAQLAMAAAPSAFAAEEAADEKGDLDEAGSVVTPDSMNDDPGEGQWVDRAHQGLHEFLWRSAMHVDGWFGAEMPEQVYAGNTLGSITPIVLWDEFNGFSQKFRFRVKMPLPHLDERFNAFVGTFSPDEFVTERDQASGAIPRQRSGGTIEQDETLLGIQYREREGGRFEADAGIRIRSPIDPFVKGGYRFEHVTDNHFILSLRETGFWRNSEGFGLTSRVDVERALDIDAMVRWTASGTISQESEGVRGYSALTLYNGLRGDRAIAGQIFTSGEFDAAVPLGEYGIRVAYRQRLFRDWFVLELRPSVTWPKDDPNQPRKASWGLGIGFEMSFGVDEFQARPITF
jgi:hypothetical protein